jgi:predicted RNA methylase
VLICELLCTGQFFEPEVQVVNHLRQYFKPTTQVIPRRVESYVQLLDAQEIFYNVRIDTDSRSLLLADDEPVSTRERYDVIDFNHPVEPEAVDAHVLLRARETRVADAVVITSRAFLTEDLVTERTRFLYNPEVIFLKHPVNLIKDRVYRVHLAYRYGADTLDATIEVDPEPVE